MKITWQEGTRLSEPRAAHATGFVGQEMILVGGSRWPTPETKLRLRRVDAYDPKRDIWRPLADYPLAVDGVTGAVAGSGNLYVAGGFDGATPRREIHRLEDVKRGGKWRQAALLPSEDGVTLAASAADKTHFYLCGGVADPNKFTGAQGKLWALDIGSEKLTALRPFPGAAQGTHTLIAAEGGLYLFGGAFVAGDRVSNSREVWHYASKSDTWHRLPDAPTAVRAWSAVAVNPQTLLLLGGYRDDVSTPGFTREIWRFQTKTGQWEPAGSLPLAFGAAPFVCSGKILCASGGEDAPNTARNAPLSVIWISHL